MIITLLKKYCFTILVLLIIFILCLMNTAPLPIPPIRNIDKYMHEIMYVGLAGVVFFDNTGYLRFSISKMRIFLGSFLFPIVIGGLIEIMQTYLTTTRTGDWLDFLFDTAGAFLGWGISLLINQYLLVKRKS